MLMPSSLMCAELHIFGNFSCSGNNKSHLRNCTTEKTFCLKYFFLDLLLLLFIIDAYAKKCVENNYF